MAFDFCLFVLSMLALSACQASNFRGGYSPQLHRKSRRWLERRLGLMDHTPSSTFCQEQLDLEITCTGDCDFKNRKATCTSRLYLYHGGPCRFVEGVTEPDADSPVTCQDIRPNDIPITPGEAVYVVLTDPDHPEKTAKMWTHVGSYFSTGYEGCPIGEGLGPIQNITFYSSEDASWETMLQTMVIDCPCEGVPLEDLDCFQSVQLIDTEVDPKIRADFEMEVSSRAGREWQIQKVLVNSNVAPFVQECPVDSSDCHIGKGVNVTLPVTMYFDRSEPLNLLATVSVTDPYSGCSVNAMYDSFRPHTPAGGYP